MKVSNMIVDQNILTATVCGNQQMVSIQNGKILPMDSGACDIWGSSDKQELEIYNAILKAYEKLAIENDDNYRIINDITLERGGHYCHALEIGDALELSDVIDSLVSEFVEKYTDKQIKVFFNTLEIYAMDDAMEDEVYDFDMNSEVSDALERYNYD